MIVICFMIRVSEFSTLKPYLLCSDRSVVLTVLGFQNSEISTLKLCLSPNVIIRRKSMATIPSGLRTSENSTFTTCLPESDDWDSLRVLTRSPRIYATYPLDLTVQIHFKHRVSGISILNWSPNAFIWSSRSIATHPSRSDGPYSLRTSGFGSFNSQLKSSKWFFPKP